MKQVWFAFGLALVSLLATAESEMAPATIVTTEHSAALGAALPDSALSGERGMADVRSLNYLGGYLFNNQAIDTVSGDNTVTDGALAGGMGLFTVIQNSGNNVLIENATILNLNIQ